MREVLTRRFSRALKEAPDRTAGSWPDLAVIDGGKGQLAVAEQVFADPGIDDVALPSIAQGPDRAAGRAPLQRPGRPRRPCAPRAPVPRGTASCMDRVCTSG